MENTVLIWHPCNLEMINYFNCWCCCSIWIWPNGADERSNWWYTWPCCWCLVAQWLNEIWNDYDWNLFSIFSPHHKVERLRFGLLTRKTIEYTVVVPAEWEICRICWISWIRGIWRIDRIRIRWINWNRWDRWNGWDPRVIGYRWYWWIWWLISRLLTATTTTNHFSIIIWMSTGCKSKA